ncbi:MAG: DUF1643 domain-containing protein [Coriobacteriales bacterium]
MSKWVYKNSGDNSYRFLLGEMGQRNLVCVGLNPSTAEPGDENLDPTMRRVRSRAIDLGYDGYLMANLYPQRATDPGDMHRAEQLDEEAVRENYATIAELFALDSFDVWAAWGAAIERRGYLKVQLLTIYDIFQNRCGDAGARWLHAGELTKGGHPRHPLYIPQDAPMREFDAYTYALNLK